jgi:glycosyltransferase involved in cell wall biosynthesis
MVIAEASAYAMPSVANNVMGVGGVLRDGRNGRLLREGASAKEYAQAIADLFRDQSAFRAMSLSAFAEYQQDLNWHAATAKVLALIRTAMGAKADAGGGDV